MVPTCHFINTVCGSGKNGEKLGQKFFFRKYSHVAHHLKANFVLNSVVTPARTSKHLTGRKPGSITCVCFGEKSIKHGKIEVMWFIV